MIKKKKIYINYLDYLDGEPQLINAPKKIMVKIFIHKSHQKILQEKILKKEKEFKMGKN